MDPASLETLTSNRTSKRSLSILSIGVCIVIEPKSCLSETTGEAVMQKKKAYRHNI